MNKLQSWADIANPDQGLTMRAGANRDIMVMIDWVCSDATANR